jgi:hypothetical protein
VKRRATILLSSLSDGGKISAGIVPAKAPDMKGLALGFLIPAGRVRGADLV